MSDGLINVFKDGSISRIHPSALKSHQAAGWKEVPKGAPVATLTVNMADAPEVKAVLDEAAQKLAELGEVVLVRDSQISDMESLLAARNIRILELENLLAKATEPQKEQAPASVPGPEAPFPNKQVPHWPTEELRRKARALGLDDSQERPALITAISEALKA